MPFAITRRVMSLLTSMLQPMSRIGGETRDSPACRLAVEISRMPSVGQRA
jgi:hypothetical protein